MPSPQWERIATFPLDDEAVGLPFSRRLQREHPGWTREFTLRAIEEYRRFFFLAVSGDEEITPSEVVDQVWHLHLIYTRSYHQLCQVAGCAYLHHGPTRGGRAEGKRFFEQYERTLERYRSRFGEPPRDVWPSASVRFANPGAGVWVERDRQLVVPRSLLERVAWGALALAAAIASLTWL